MELLQIMRDRIKIKMVMKEALLEEKRAASQQIHKFK